MVCMMCSICVVQIQPMNHGLEHAGYTAPTRQRELIHTDHIDHIDHTDHTDHTDNTDHTDHSDHIDQQHTCPERSRPCGNRLSEACTHVLETNHLKL